MLIFAECHHGGPNQLTVLTRVKQESLLICGSSLDATPSEDFCFHLRLRPRLNSVI